MARVPAHGESYFPGWLSPSTLGAALLRAGSVDWQNAITDQEGLADVRAFLSAHLGAYVSSITGLEFNGDRIDLAYTDQSGAAQTAQVDLSFLVQGLATLDGHSEGWSAVRINPRTYGVTQPAIWVYADGNGDLQIGDNSGRVNGELALSPGQSTWRHGAANANATFWAQRGDILHVHYQERGGPATGAHVHETGNASIYGIAATDDAVWLLLYSELAGEVRLITYAVDDVGAQDPVPDTTLPYTVITSQLPSGIDPNAALRGLALSEDGGTVYVLLAATDSGGAAVTEAWAFASQSPFAQQSLLDRQFGVHDGIVDGLFQARNDYLVQPHWIVRYSSTSLLDHVDTPEAFGGAGIPLVVNAAGDGMEFARLPSSGLGSPFVLLNGDTALPNDDITELAIDFSRYANLALVVKDNYRRSTQLWILPYETINAAAVSTADTIAAAGNHALVTTAWLGSHLVPVGLVRRANNAVGVGSVHDADEPMRVTLVGEFTGGTTTGSAWIHGQIAIPGSAPDYGLFGVSFGDEGANISWFKASDLLDKTLLANTSETPTDANSILMPGVGGGRDVRLGRIEYTQGLVHRTIAFWIGHSGHTPYPFRIYRSWTSGLTDITVRADVYGLGRRD